MELDFNVLIWPILCVVIVTGLVAVKVVVEMRKNAPPPQKKQGFNASGQRRSFGSESERTLSLPRIPGLDLPDEIRSIIWLVALGIVGFTIVVFVGYELATMQWLDEDGHPVSMPAWIWPLLCVLVAAGALAFKIMSGIDRTPTVSSNRPAISRPQAPGKPARPTGFNKQGKSLASKKPKK